MKEQRLRQAPCRHELLDTLDDEIDDQALGKGEHVAQPGDDDVLDVGRGDHLLHDRGEVFHDDDDFRAGILELMFQLPRGVERVAIHHRVAGPQSAEHRNRVLQDVRHHQRDARASPQLQHALQIGGEATRQALHLGVADRGSHVDECGARAELRGAHFE